MAQFRASVIAALIAAGVTATTEEGTIKKEFFKASRGPLSKAQLPDLLKALAGDTSVVIADSEAEAKKQTKAAATGTPKTPKEPKAPATPKAQETGEQALARLKASADTKISGRWARVTEVLEMGKRGPTRVRILCDDKGQNGEDLHRDIKVQDLFQVRFSAGYQKKRTASKPKQEQEAATVAAS